MGYSTGIIGPARLLDSITRILAAETSIWPQIHPVGLVYTDHPPQTESLPVYSFWKDLIQEHDIDVVLNLSGDPELRAEIRSELPPQACLMEDVPGQWMHALFRAHRVWVKKQESKNQFLAQTLDSLPFPAILFNDRGLVLHWNQSCAKLTDASPEKVLGTYEAGSYFYSHQRPLLGQIILEEKDADGIAARFEHPETDFTPLENGVQVSGYLQLRGRLPGYYLLTAQRIVLDGKVIGSLELIQDMSAITMLKSQLKEHKDTLQLMMTHLPFPLLSTDLSGRIRFKNTAAQKEFLNKMGTDTAGDRHNIFCYLKQAAGGEEIDNLSSWLTEVPYATKPSRTLTLGMDDLQWEVTCIKTGDNESESALWILRNISEKESEDRLSTALAFSGALSHELAQPLTAISNSARLLSRTDPADKERIKKHNYILERESERVMAVYRKLQNLTSYKLQGYLDTQIMDLDDSSDDLHPFETPGEDE
jgi:PAS domain-containing protein